MPSLLTCKQCGQPILGNYLNALGATWHPEHFVCAACGRPIGDTSFQVHLGAPYHIECYRNQLAPRCAYCGKPLMGEYLVDHWGTKFCTEHSSRYPACSFCGRLVPPQQQEHDARSNADVRCPICKTSAIESTTQAQPVFTRLIRWVNTQGLLYNNLHISLELCDRSKLATLLQVHAEPHSLGVTLSSTYTQNGQVVRIQVDRVAVLQGLPSTLFQGVTIHELVQLQETFCARWSTT